MSVPAAPPLSVAVRVMLCVPTVSNDVANKFKVLKKIIQIYVKLNKHELIIKELDRILHETVSVAFMDLSTVAGFHRQLGDSLLQVGQDKEALSELLIALNTYKKFPKLNEDILDHVGTCIDFNGQDNLTFDCDNHLIDGDYVGSDYGIYASATSDDINIQNCLITNFDRGIYLNSPGGSINVENIISNNNSLYGFSVTGVDTINLDNLFLKKQICSFLPSPI